MSRSQFALCPMNDTIFQDRLQGQFGDTTAVNRCFFLGITFNGKLQSVAETILLNFKISHTVLQFFFH